MMASSMTSMMMDTQLSISTAQLKAVLFQINEKLEDLRLKLNEPTSKLTNEGILMIISELQGICAHLEKAIEMLISKWKPLYKKMIILDVEGAIQRQLETFMWNDCFKTPLTHFGRNDLTLFHFMIENGVAFYLGFIQDIGIHFDIGFIKNTSHSLYGPTPVMKTIFKACSSKSAVYYIIQNSLIHVGDLLRYRGSFLEALKMYDKSTALCPTNGHPFNQMGLVQVLVDNKSIDSLLAAVYYHARAVSVTNSFVSAQNSLDGLLAKVKSIPSSNKLEGFIHHFLTVVGNPESIVIQSSSSTSLANMLAPLITNGSISSNQLFRIIVVGLWSWRRESSKSLLAFGSSSESCVLEIIAAIINSLLTAVVAYSDLTTFYALAHLKILMDWLRVNSSVLNNPSFRAKLNTQTLCKFFNQLLLTVENNVCSLKTKEMENIILSEEKRLLGFLPLCRTYEHLNCVMEDTDAHAVWIRIYRTLKCADSLAQSRLGFMERTGTSGLYSEIQLVSQMPTAMRASDRWNVPVGMPAGGIFNQWLTELPSPLGGDSARGFESDLPVSTKTQIINAEAFEEESILRSPPLSYYLNGQGHTNNFLTSTADLFRCSTTPLFKPNSLYPFSTSSDTDSVGTDAELDSPDFSQLFCSIWTPLQNDMNKNSSDGW